MQKESNYSEQRKMLTLSEFCTRYGISRATAYRILAAGVLTAKKIGSRVLIPLEAIEMWEQSLPAAVFRPSQTPVSLAVNDNKKTANR